MEAASVRKAAVIGAGVMGSGIAQVLAQAGVEVNLVDVDDRALARASEIIQSSLNTLAEHGSLPHEAIPSILQRIHLTTDVTAAVAGAQFVEEVVPEAPAIKRQVLEQLDALLPSDVVIASNTSSLDIFSLAEFGRPQRMVIAHWFAPPHIIPLIEVVPGPLTAPKTVASTMSLLERIGKKPVALKGFIGGFIVNRVQLAVHVEMSTLLESGLVTPEDIDTAVKHTLGIRLPVVGVAQSVDFNGLDVASAVGRALGHRLPYFEQKVQEGHLGVKTGQGFYDYAGRREVDILKRRDELYLKLRDYLEAIDAFEPL